jgi:mannosylglycerate hydrolase
MSQGKTEILLNSRMHNVRVGSDRKVPNIHCHFVSNTHWDREWRVSFQKTRYRLVQMMDMLFDILEREPAYRSFLLDSQSVPIQDYLEIRPEKEELLKKYVSQDRIQIGPWFTLPDEFCVGGESLIRNLLLGHRIARRFGKVSKTGYSPFSWGQISQLPQIYSGFGISFAAFYRGINKLVAPRSEFYWQSPDGSRILASRLSTWARYNTFYSVQKPVYWNDKSAQETMTDRTVHWSRGHGPFKLINTSLANRDFQLAHPRFEYHLDKIARLTKDAIEEQNDDWTTQHRLWSCGDDVSWPDIRETRLINDCIEALAETARITHSTFADFQNGLLQCADLDLPVLTGEMRNPYTTGSSSALMGEIISARMHIKQENFRAERDLTWLAEPAAVCAALLGAPYPLAFIDTAYNWLLQNHGHDSIGCCSRDYVADDIMNRLRQSRDISDCILESALRDIASSIDLSAYRPEDLAVVIYNPTSRNRTDTIAVALEIPAEWKASDIQIFDEFGRIVTLQQIGRTTKHYTSMKEPTDALTGIAAERHNLYAEFTDVPALGYKTFFVKPCVSSLACEKNLCTGSATLENGFLAAKINANGTIDIRDKGTRREFKNLAYFSDCSETGDAWTHKPAAQEKTYTTLEQEASVELIENGPLSAAFKVTIDWGLPQSCIGEQYLTARSSSLKPFKIVSTISLRRNRPWLEITTELENNVLDHYLQVMFPTNLKTDILWAQGQFDVLRRSFKPLDPLLYEEKIQRSAPMTSFVSADDGTAGIAILNEGLKSYEAHYDSVRTISLALLRCFPVMMCAENFWDRDKYTGRFSRPADIGMQCPGRHVFHYGIMPHSGRWDQAGVWQAAEDFNLELLASQIGPTPRGSGPLSRSFLEITPDVLHVSAVKKSESGEGWIVRIFNPYDSKISARLRLNGGFTGPLTSQSPVERQEAEYELPAEKGNMWSSAQLVSLEEIPEKDLAIDLQGWCAFEIEPKKILTLHLRPF